MNNTRYNLGTLPAAAVVTGGLSATVLTMNGLRLLGVIPDVPTLRLMAPLGATFAFLALTLVILWARATGSPTRDAVTYTGLAAVTATAALAVIEVITHYVLAQIPAPARGQALAGPLMAFLVVASIGFLVSILAFSAALLRSRLVPWLPLAILCTGSALLGLRAQLPPALGAVGVIAIGIGLLLLVISVARRAPEPATA